MRNAGRSAANARASSWPRRPFSSCAAGPAAAAAPDKTKGFFPVSVWYSGGKARAPMLETVTPESREVWKKDIDQIKRLGFNTVRTWIEWTACEKSEGTYDFSALELLTDLAGEAGLRVIVQVYIDSAPDWVGVPSPRLQVRVLERRRRRVAGLAGLLLRPRRRPGEDPRLLQGRRPGRQGQARLLRLGPLERAPHHQLGRGLLRRRPLVGPVLLLPLDPVALPGMAQEEIRDDRGPEQGLVPDAHVLRRGPAAALRHHPDLHRLHRLEGIHLRQAGRGPGPQGRGRQVRPAGHGRHQPLGRAGDLHPAGLVGNARRPEDVRQRRFLRRLDLPQARLDDQALVALLPLLGPRLRPVHGHRRTAASISASSRPATASSA